MGFKDFFYQIKNDQIQRLRDSENRYMPSPETIRFEQAVRRLDKDYLYSVVKDWLGWHDQECLDIQHLANYCLDDEELECFELIRDKTWPLWRKAGNMYNPDKLQDIKKFLSNLIDNKKSSDWLISLSRKRKADMLAEEEAALFRERLMKEFGKIDKL